MQWYVWYYLYLQSSDDSNDSEDYDSEKDLPSVKDHISGSKVDYSSKPKSSDEL